MPRLTDPVFIYRVLLAIIAIIAIAALCYVFITGRPDKPLL